MKRYILTAITTLMVCISTQAMSYQRAREEALYLTDKMAYELNLNDLQYNDAYEINLDYFMSINTERDLYADYLSYRLTDLRHILYNWQYDLLLRAEYFIRPIIWRSGHWHFPIYSFYARGHFYYHCPTVYHHYRGGHSHRHHRNGFYAHRRPQWNGGLRGPERQHAGRQPEHNRRPDSGHIKGNGYHIDMPGRTNDRAQNRNNNIQTPNRGGNTQVTNRNVQTVSREQRRSFTYTPQRNSTSRGNSFNRSSSRTTVSNHSGNISRGSTVSRSSNISRGSSVSRSNNISRGSSATSRGNSSSSSGGRGGR